MAVGNQPIAPDDAMTIGIPDAKPARASPVSIDGSFFAGYR
jgi:hypothetical protein